MALAGVAALQIRARWLLRSTMLASLEAQLRDWAWSPAWHLQAAEATVHLATHVLIILDSDLQGKRDASVNVNGLMATLGSVMSCAAGQRPAANDTQIRWWIPAPYRMLRRLAHLQGLHGTVYFGDTSLQLTRLMAMRLLPHAVRAATACLATGSPSRPQFFAISRLCKGIGKINQLGCSDMTAALGCPRLLLAFLQAAQSQREGGDTFAQQALILTLAVIYTAGSDMVWLREVERMQLLPFIQHHVHAHGIASLLQTASQMADTPELFTAPCTQGGAPVALPDNSFLNVGHLQHALQAVLERVQVKP